MDKVGILEADNFSKEAIAFLRKRFEVELFSGGNATDFVCDKTALFIRLGYLIDDVFLENAHKLKYICTPTTGLNHIKTTQEINIISLKGETELLSTIRATPEHTFGLSLALLRNYSKAFLNTYNHTWDRNLYRGEEIYENKVGIIGYGRVGKILGRYCKCFGARVYYYDVNQNLENQDRIAVPVATIEELCKKANIIFLCASYSKEYDSFLERSFFSLLEGKYFINTSRGELVDEDAFIDFIEKGSYKGIAFDVIANETSDNHLNRFLKAAENKNVIITPHIAGATYNSMHKTEEFIAKKFCELYEMQKKNG